MIFGIGFIIFVIGNVLCDWNERQPYTWRDRWFPYIHKVGFGVMLGSIVIFLSRILP